jgi:hypothetical protein
MFDILIFDIYYLSEEYTVLQYNTCGAAPANTRFLQPIMNSILKILICSK